MKGFIEYIRKQGVIGLAIGFLLGGAVSKLVTAFVTDIVNPLVGIIFKGNALQQVSLKVGPAWLLIGDFTAVFIDFVIVALVIYFGFKALRLDKLDDPAEES